MRLEFEPNLTAMPLVENEIFDDIGSAAPPDLASLLKNGIAAAQNGERETAGRDLLSQAAEIEPRCEDAWMWLASISDYPEELLAFLNHVLDINPNNQRAAEWSSATRSLLAKTFVQRAAAAHEDGGAELAAQCLEQALVFDPECEMAWFWKASVSKTDDQKLECLEQVLTIDPENAEALAAIATIKRAGSDVAFTEAKAAAVAGKRKKALDLVDEFLRYVTDNAEAWVLRSHLSLSLEEKIQSLEKALEIDPANGAARSSYDFLTATIGSTIEQPETEISEPAETTSQPMQEASPWPDTEPEPEPKPEPEIENETVPARSVEEMFGPITEDVDAEQVTVERLSLPEVLDTFDTGGKDVEPEQKGSVDFYEIGEVSANISIEDLNTAAEVEVSTAEDQAELSLAEAQASAFACPFCMAINDPQAFECSSCYAILTLSDIDTLLSNQRADREMIQLAVTQMEAEWNLREFSEAELTALGIGHFNLNNLESGLKYLQEASRLDPNNVILAGQVNAIAIRLDEMSRRSEVHESRAVGKTILVVDDSPTVRKLIAGKLEKSGHTVVCAVDGIDALARLEENLPDLVLLDIAMPRMDGYEVCKQIRANPAASDLPVVMISGKDGFFDKVRGRMAGTTAYVTKPFGPETLMKALETYLLPEAEEVS